MPGRPRSLRSSESRGACASADSFSDDMRNASRISGGFEVLNLVRKLLGANHSSRLLRSCDERLAVVALIRRVAIAASRFRRVCPNKFVQDLSERAHKGVPPYAVDSFELDVVMATALS